MRHLHSHERDQHLAAEALRETRADGPHGHHHAVDGGERRVRLALAILACFTVVEAAGGYFANSIALLAEAVHMLADSAALLLAMIALHVSRRPADVRRTYGHRRYQPLAAFVNGQALLLLTLGVVYQAVLRLLHPPMVNAPLMLAIALLGGVANLAAFLALSAQHSLNERSARAHVLSDLLGSGAATLAAILVLVGGWSVADPLLSLLVAALILRFAWSLTRQSADVLLEGVPAGFDVGRIETELLGHVPGLTGVHHVHVWSMTGERPTVTLHANFASGTPYHVAITAIHARLEERLNVEHCTVQIEEDGRCHTPACRPPG
jgi:cobalt-zinc-cadmium efflux system protein